MMAGSGRIEPRIDVILGRCDDMRAEVYVRATGLRPTEELPVISGSLTGPESRLAITLPAAARLSDLGAGPGGSDGGASVVDRSAVARGILTEPGYWTPELPHRYRLLAEVRAGGDVIASCDRLVGLRRLGIRGRSMWLEGRRWVPRGVVCVAGELEPGVFRDLLATAVLDDPEEVHCTAADEAGVAIIARCGGDPVAGCLRWARHPSVMMTVLPRGTDAAAMASLLDAIRPFKGTMLLGLQVDGGEPPPVVPEGIDCFVMSLAAGRMPDGAWHEPPTMPALATRPTVGDIRARRAACDALQADLAAWRGSAASGWDWAGYL
jgi:hypothetical protein